MERANDKYSAFFESYLGYFFPFGQAGEAEKNYWTVNTVYFLKKVILLGRTLKEREGVLLLFQDEEGGLKNLTDRMFFFFLESEKCVNEHNFLCIS